MNRGKGRTGIYAIASLCVNLTHLFFKDIQMVTLEHHKAISPDFSENAFATELADPAHFVWLCGGWRSILNTLL